MHSDLDYLAHLANESARFGTALGQVSPGAPVPTCPGWDVTDLLWHLGWVQWWFTAIVRDGLTGREANKLSPSRPADKAGVAAFYEQVRRDLADSLAATPADAPVWTWTSDGVAGFIRRRIAHEVLIHRIDAELTAGARSAMDPALSADGVDEVLRVMYPTMGPTGAVFTADPAQTLRIQATDTGDTWVATLGRLTSDEPAGTDAAGASADDAGATRDAPDFEVAAADDGQPAAALISGTAADLDCWLYHRPSLAPVTCSGDEAAIAQFKAAIAPGIN